MDRVITTKSCIGADIISQCSTSIAIDFLINNSGLIPHNYHNKIKIYEEDRKNYGKHATSIMNIFTTIPVNSSDNQATKIPCFATCDGESNLSFVELLYSIVERFRHEFSKLGIEIDKSISQDIKKNMSEKGHTCKEIWEKYIDKGAYRHYDSQYPDNFQSIMTCLIWLDMEYPDIMMFPTEHVLHPEELNYKADPDNYELLFRNLNYSVSPDHLNDSEKLALKYMDPNYTLGVFKHLFSSNLIQLMQLSPLPHKNVEEIFVERATHALLRALHCKEDVPSPDVAMKLKDPFAHGILLENLFACGIDDSNMSIGEFITRILISIPGLTNYFSSLGIEINLFKLNAISLFTDPGGTGERDIFFLLDTELFQEARNIKTLLGLLILLEIEHPSIIRGKTARPPEDLAPDTKGLCRNFNQITIG